MFRGVTGTKICASIAMYLRMVQKPVRPAQAPDKPWAENCDNIVQDQVMYMEHGKGNAKSSMAALYVFLISHFGSNKKIKQLMKAYLEKKNPAKAWEAAKLGFHTAIVTKNDLKDSLADLQRP